MFGRYFMSFPGCSVIFLLFSFNLVSQFSDAFFCFL